MKVLAIDTSTMVAAVAVKENNMLIGEYILNSGRTHSEKLMPIIMELMSGIGLTPHDIDLFAVSLGPGSFTGLRIGIVTIKALAYAMKKPVVGIPTLDALAYNIPESDKLICPMIDARNMQVYTAVYSWDQGLFSKISDYMAVPINELIEKLIEMGRQCIFVGDAVLKHKDLLMTELKDKAFFAPDNLLLQRASSVAELGLLRYLDGQYDDPFKLVPFYLRKSQAERFYDQKCADR